MQEDRVDLRDIVDVIKRHHKLIFYTVCGAIIAALLFNQLPPTYEAVVNMRVKPSRGPGEVTGTLSAEEMLRQQIFTYAEILKSRTVVERVIDKVFSEKEDKPAYTEFVRRREAQPVKNTEILSVSVQASSPETAQTIANALVETFNERIIDIVRMEGKEARVFIGERLAEAKRNLDKAEKAMVEYKKKNQTISMSDQTKSFLDRQSGLIKLALDNQVALETARARQDSVNQQLPKKNPGFVVESPLIAIYKSKLADQEVELVGLRRSLKEDHPKIKAQLAAIEETKTKLKAETSLQAQIDVAASKAQKLALEKVSLEMDKEMTKLPDKEQGLARLMRDYTISEELYTMLAKRYEESRINEAMQPVNVQVVDMASLPDRPVKPRKFLNLAIALVAGLFIGINGAFLADYFNKTVDSAADVQRHLGLTVIGKIPRSTLINVQEKKSLWSQLKMKTRRTNYG